MSNRLKSVLQRVAAAAGLADVRRDLDRLALGLASISQPAQLLLKMRYAELRERPAPRPRFDDVEFRVFSQNGEDGILLYVFSLIGTTDKRCVEICAGDGRQCNTSNLIVNHGWTGWLFESDAGLVARAREFFASHPDTFTHPPTLVPSWVTCENVNTLLEEHGVRGEIDLLSLDLDGVDYWIWKAIDRIAPRVVVAEVQVIWGDTDAVTVPYRPDFVAEFVDGFGVYSGASLPAFVGLARAKGYRLIGCQRYGFNAFFMRRGIGEDVFPEVSAADCLRHPFVASAQRRFLPGVRDKPWVRV
jgi:hypothetical protein